MQILKFGGSSVANSERISIVVGIIKQKASENSELAIVVSAQSGVTDQLIKLCSLIPGQAPNCEILLSDLEQKHLATIRGLASDSQLQTATEGVKSLCNELSNIVKGASLVGEVTARTSDLILSFGERLSAYIITQALKSDFPNVIYTDARQLIRTDSSFGRARVDFESSNELIKEYFTANKGMKVITGFIGSTLQGQTTTLGRSGSDYTASIVGAALNAETIEIWSDVDGVMTADPRYVSEAQSIRQLSYNEAMELSHFGAKIIFPATMYPAMMQHIPILVKNTFNPEHKGTLISTESTRDNGFVKGITSLRNICLINVEGSGMVGVAGVSARMFSALSKKQISVILISQASSEHSICIGLMEEDAEKACQLLRHTFAEELSEGLISSIGCEKNLAIIAVVGGKMCHMPGVAARVFSPLGRNGINVIAISQGSSELNISFAIHENDLKKALRVLHQSLFNKEMRRLHLFIAGTGSVGGRLIDMIANHDKYLVSQKIDLQLCGAANHIQMVMGEKPINTKKCRTIMEKESEQPDLKKFVKGLLQQNLENSVFIDVTASDEPVQFYNELLAGNIAIVAANKRANTQSLEKYHQLHTTAKNRNVPFHYETNVGAGLPVINVLRSLSAGGDQVVKIEAVLSGTMNWLLSEYDGSKPFSDLVKIAKENGFTEPDPRDDLSGMDVSRKCLILARECGLEIELKDIPVVPLMSAEAAKAKDVPAFFEELKNYDSSFQIKYLAAKASGKKLRYVGTVEKGTAKVELIEVDANHAFYSLIGTENCLILTTNYYKKYPMVIKGPGAGVDVTAAGILADIVRIAEGIRM